MIHAATTIRSILFSFPPLSFLSQAPGSPNSFPRLCMSAAGTNLHCFYCHDRRGALTPTLTTGRPISYPCSTTATNHAYMYNRMMSKRYVVSKGGVYME
ncbi:hypothetical protein F5Y14DRAFT_405347 [Nemania sp. NC0429]|nr:hypothetical protein F5Y14DRAFT_405347 [Nemania sp. NC0429]